MVLGICLAIFVCAPALAQSKPTTPTKTKRIDLQQPAEIEGGGPYDEANPPVIELEADVIEGEKKLPAIFLEFEAHAPTLDSVIYQRADFNDVKSGKIDVPLKFQPQRKGK